MTYDRFVLSYIHRLKKRSRNMQAHTIGTLPAEDNKKAAVFLRARTNNTVWKSHFSQAQQIVVVRVSDMLHTFFNQKPYVNYRITLASIKFTRNAAKTKQFKQYEKHLESQGWVKKFNTKGDIIYAIKKELIS